ncbi:MAG: AAA family ATPase [Thermoleophilia bacterium]
MSRQVVCISHATGAGGEDVGRAVAERLGFQYVDNEVISEAADWAELDPALVADVERRKPFVARLLGGWGGGGGDRMPSGERSRVVPGDPELRALIQAVLRRFADRGSVVIVAHAASFALAGGDVLRVLITASPGTRATRLAQADGTAEADGERQIKTEDEARAGYLKTFYGVERELPTHYDVVVNTDVLTADEAARLVEVAATT